MTDEHFGIWLKNIRLERGLTQEVLGERIGVKHTTIQRYEAGTRNVPFEVMLQLADALPVPRSRATAAWIVANGGQTGYELDSDVIPVPEGYSDTDTATRMAASRVAQEAFRAFVDALRDARRLSPGTVGFGEDRYDKKPGAAVERAEEPATDGGQTEESDG